MSELLAVLPEKRVIGEPPRSVSSIAADSRRVEPGGCFVAVPGFKQDGRRFIPEAVRRGAAVVVTEGEPVAGLSVAQVLVPSVRVSLARLAGAFYGHPSRYLTLVGITGTNGKTTTSYLIDALLRARGLATGVIGTIQYVLGDETRPASQTTPEALDLQSMLAHMRDGSVVARARARARRRPCLRRGGVHEPDAGPPRLPRDARELPARQAPAVRAPRRVAQAPPHRRRQRRRSGRRDDGQRAGRGRAHLRARRLRARQSRRARVIARRHPDGGRDAARPLRAHVGADRRA